KTWLIYSHKLTTNKTFSFFSPLLE
ncbi:dihydropteroate synthase, partial [Listeria monocytogenes]|nr:dihydropteroate synthase [Listeria monocytogenes]EAF4522910.1 dihydropteroate synthase [Listeria monocytogenes serotype 4b]EAF4525834.1 dihydropteroate synthase [Listeria monocytogenes serotype 1/2a]EAC5753460.1 dihydropteroate synthase [Listeria monocytogenes]EAC5889102.1 dihydropteroate synthase [Listeria monocytogenes]